MRARAHSTRVKSTAKSRPTPPAPMLRVIGGKWRGLKLHMPEYKATQESKTTTQARISHRPANTHVANTHVGRDSATTRPTKSIVRESFFNTLAHEIYGACFIEGFAGSGSMGIEALSRGARVGVFCERDLCALHALERNLSLLPIATHHALDSTDSSELESNKLDSGGLGLVEQVDSSQQAYILRDDSFISLPSAFAWLESRAFRGVLYLDPPFCIRENYADIYEKCASLIASIGGASLRHIIIEHSSAYVFAEQIGRFIQHKTRRFGKSTLTYFIQGA